MSVLIKGMEMPRNCYECPFEKDVFYNRSDDTICAITGKLTGINKCPLVEIVHCKDCVYRSIYPQSDNHYWCNQWYASVLNDYGYCYKGSKESEDEK